MDVPVGDGVRLHVQQLGVECTPVVLVPGFGLDHRLWDREARVLARAGHRVSCVDPRGHGRSDMPLTAYSVDRLAADLIAVLETLGEPAMLVGWSFAGQVAFRVAAQRPDLVSRLTLVCSNAVRASRSDDFPFGGKAEELERLMVDAELADRFAARRQSISLGFASPPDEKVLDWLVQVSLGMPSWAALDCHRSMLRTDLLAGLPHVTMPVLQVVGAADPVFSPYMARGGSRKGSRTRSSWSYPAVGTTRCWRLRMSSVPRLPSSLRGVAAERAVWSPSEGLPDVGIRTRSLVREVAWSVGI